jgi:hypothetical protein
VPQPEPSPPPSKVCFDDNYEIFSGFKANMREAFNMKLNEQPIGFLMAQYAGWLLKAANKHFADENAFKAKLDNFIELFR